MFRSLIFGSLLFVAVPIARAQSPPPPPKSPPVPAFAAQVPFTTAPAPQAQATPVVFAAVARPAKTIAWGPGPLSLMGAAIGRQLAKLDRQHVWTINHTVLTPVAAAPIFQPAAVAPLAVAQQPVQYFAIAAPVQQPVVQYHIMTVPAVNPSPSAQPSFRLEAAPPPPVVPSPQR